MTITRIKLSLTFNPTRLYERRHVGGIPSAWMMPARDDGQSQTHTLPPFTASLLGAHLGAGVSLRRHVTPLALSAAEDMPLTRALRQVCKLR